MEKNSCCVFGGINLVYYELLRTRPLLFSTEHNWWDWAEQGKTHPPLYYSKHDNIILLHDKARSHVAAPVKTLETLKWEVLPHSPYSSDIAPSDYHLFRSMTHGLCHLSSTSHHEDIKNCINDWIVSKDEAFFRRGIHMLERWEKVVASDGHYFE